MSVPATQVMAPEFHSARADVQVFSLRVVAEAGGLATPGSDAAAAMKVVRFMGEKHHVTR